MSYHLGRRSRRFLSTADYRFSLICKEGIKIIDFSVTESHRGRRKQNKYFRKGLSKVRFPFGKHNSLPSKAIHIEPWPTKWPDKDDPEYPKQLARFYHLAGIIIGIGESLGYKVRWGGDWNMDGDIMDQDFDDLTHFEIRD